MLAMVLALALATLSCSEPVRSAPSQDATTGSETMQNDVAVGTLRVTCIDVGKGDCILVQAGGRAMLIDTGYKDTAAQVLSHLREQGVSQLDVVILTHYDRDHVEGLGSLASSLAVGTVYLPGYEGSDKNYTSTMATVDRLGLTSQRVTKEMALQLGEAQLTIYPSGVNYVPGSGGDEGNDNDVSLVVTLTHGKDSYLFAGDLEEEGIEAYLDAAHGHFDVLKVPHHGEKSGNIDELIDSVQPAIALITDGSDEPADKKVLKLLQKRDVDTYRTATDGTIAVTSDGAGNYEVTLLDQN